MIEILFGKSEAASMKAAKSRVSIVHADGPMAVFCAGKKKAPEREHCGWVEGMADEVICLDFALDEGEAEGTYRGNRNALSGGAFTFTGISLGR